MGVSEELTNKHFLSVVMNLIDKNNFLYQRYRYLGKHTPQNFLFNANLQEFSERVCYLSNLQTSGKISSEECYERIE